MVEEKKIVKGGFRATLALIISIIALVVAVMAYNKTSGEADLKAQVNDLKTRLEKAKGETSKRFNKLRDETSNALENLSKKIKKDKTTQ